MDGSGEGDGNGIVIGTPGDGNDAANQPNSLLLAAAQNGDAAGVRAALDAGADINATFIDGSNAIFWAALGGHEEVFDLLLETGADAANANSEGVTVLHHLASNGMAARIRAVVADGRAGENLSPGDEEGATPLHFAAAEDRVDAVEALIAAGAGLEATTDEGMTPLFLAVMMGQAGAAKVLLDAGANPDAANEDGETPRSMAEEPELIELMGSTA